MFHGWLGGLLYVLKYRILDVKSQMFSPLIWREVGEVTQVGAYRFSRHHHLTPRVISTSAARRNLTGSTGPALLWKVTRVGAYRFSCLHHLTPQVISTSAARRNLMDSTGSALLWKVAPVRSLPLVGMTRVSAYRFSCPHHLKL